MRKQNLFFVLGMLFFAYPGLAETKKAPSLDPAGGAVMWIGAVSYNCVLTPLMKFEAGEWSCPWTTRQEEKTPYPGNAHSGQLPEGLDGIPKEWIGGHGKIPVVWRLGENPRGPKSFKVIGLTYSPFHDGYWGLETSLKDGCLEELTAASIDRFASTGDIQISNFIEIGGQSSERPTVSKIFGLDKNDSLAKAGPFSDGLTYFRFAKRDGSTGIVMKDQAGNMKRFFSGRVDDFSIRAVAKFQNKLLALAIADGTGPMNIHLVDLGNKGSELLNVPYFPN